MPNGYARDLSDFDSSNMINVLFFLRFPLSQEYHQKCPSVLGIRNFVCHGKCRVGQVLECGSFRNNMENLLSFLEELLVSVLLCVRNESEDSEPFKTSSLGRIEALKASLGVSGVSETTLFETTLSARIDDIKARKAGLDDDMEVTRGVHRQRTESLEMEL
jgi:hypothetical protein